MGVVWYGYGWRLLDLGPAVNCANTGFGDVTALQRGSSKYMTDQDTHFSQKQ